MSGDRQTERQTCHCGHDVASHYRDRSVQPSKVVSCLCTGCDCAAYANENGPKPFKPPKRPSNHPYQCRCSSCKAYLDYLTSLGP